MSKVTHLTLDESGGLSRKRIHLREISDNANAPLETVGQDLRAGRMRRGEDLSTVARVLKIRKDHLEALEEDRFEALPGRTYAIGFVRSYADYLGLDPVEAVERFKSEIAGRDQGGRVPVLEREPQDERRMPQGWKIIAGVLVLFLAFIAWRLIRSANSLVEAPVTPVPAAIAPAKPVLRVAPPAARPALTPPPAAVPATGAAGGPAAPASGGAATPAQPGTAPAATVAPGQASAQPGAAAPAPLSLADQVKALPQGHVYGEHNKEPRIVLRAVKPVRILVQGPPPKQVTYMSRLLQPGDSYQVPDIVGTTLSTRDPDALAVELDGQLMGLDGQAGHMAEGQSLDPQAVVDRFSHAPQH